ncbi:hypothetical protein MNBD_GAMMA08-45 [hydrothermal vent metagenome]|uniref:Uncharacterized protein n=1 Tax=hydrothermal vent metagenome TaxID=652676 RepID=A0A3B0XAF4_9ZZZZ
MQDIAKKLFVSSMIALLWVTSSVSVAANNPFKKSKTYTFGSSVPWYENNDTAIKSGSVRDGSNTNYYHLNINKRQLLLRLGKNDPSGELENTRPLENLTISDVKVDGRRLPLFGWCLQNQQNAGKKLKQNAVVANDVCINAGGGGDFIINLDDRSRAILKASKKVEFSVEPFGRVVKLNFNMAGYAPIMAKINKPAPSPVVKKPKPKPKPVVVKAKPKPKPKPVAVKAKPKPAKVCHARAPEEFKSAVQAVKFTCGNKASKSRAEHKIAESVVTEKKKRNAERLAAENEKLVRELSTEDGKREAVWEKQQAKLWIKRCERHWAKKTSPCYCEKYLAQAPSGVKNTCGK